MSYFYFDLLRRHTGSWTKSRAFATYRQLVKTQIYILCSKFAEIGRILISQINNPTE